MKKTLIAMAALAAAGTVAAQSSVTMYGRVNTGAYYQKKTETLSGTKTTTTTSGFRNNPAGGGTSRLGFKGSEALGNGLSATFQLEMGFCGATGVFSPGETSVGFNRGATVGFKGAFGEVKVGYSGDPFFNFDGSYKAIDNTSAFDNRVKTASGKNAEYRGRHPGIFYSGTFSDVTVEASVGQSGENKKETGNPDTKTNRSTYGLGLGYASGPLAVGAAVQFDKDKGTTDTTTTSYGIGATYDFNVAKLYAQYKGGRVKNDSSATVDKANYDQYAVGISAPFGATTLAAEYGYNKGKQTHDAAKTTYNGNVFSVRAQYQLSKRTSIYARAAQNADWKVKSGITKGDKGNTRHVGVGLMHAF